MFWIWFSDLLHFPQWFVHSAFFPVLPPEPLRWWRQWWWWWWFFFPSFVCRLRLSLIFIWLSVCCFLSKLRSSYNVVFGFDVFILNFGLLYAIDFVLICSTQRRRGERGRMEACWRNARNILVNRCPNIVTIERLRVLTWLRKEKNWSEKNNEKNQTSTRFQPQRALVKAQKLWQMLGKKNMPHETLPEF